MLIHTVSKYRHLTKSAATVSIFSVYQYGYCCVWQCCNGRLHYH